MKQQEIIQRITKLEASLNSLNANEKIAEIDTLKTQASALVQNIEDERSSAENIKSEIATIATDATSHKTIIDSASVAASEYQKVINSQKDEYTTSKGELEGHKVQYKELVETTKGVLGVANAEVLANSFKEPAAVHKQSTGVWFNWIVGSTIVLAIASAVVVAWEFLTSNLFLSANFLIKTTITAPFIFFLAFATKQYSREKRLHEEYCFKSAVALSLEAYRRLINDPSEPTLENQKKVLDFVITSISGIYSSPIENMHKYKEASSIATDVVDQLMSAAPNLGNLSSPKDQE